MESVINAIIVLTEFRNELKSKNIPEKNLAKLDEAIRVLKVESEKTEIDPEYVKVAIVVAIEIILHFLHR